MELLVRGGSVFRVDYLKPSGAIGFYHPDFVVVQSTSNGEVNWIVETKGRVWEDTEAKDAAITHWYEEVSEQNRAGGPWRYVRVNQTLFDSGSSWNSFGELIRASLSATKADTEDILPLAESPPPPEPIAQQIEETPASETTEKPGEEGPPPDLRAAAAALHASLPDGERMPSQRLLEKAALRLGYRSSSRKVRRALGQALAAEQRARRLRFDPERKLAWRPKRKKPGLYT